MTNITIEFAKECAWRGMYMYLRDKQIFRITIDPMDGVRPHLGLGLLHRSIRIPMPYVPFLWCTRANYHPMVTWIYKVSKLFWRKVDGRSRGRG
jgi:hypothetical protein